MNNTQMIYKNIPLQKCLCIIVVLDNRNLDLFIDGEIVMNYLLEEVPHYVPQELTITENGGFNGKIGYLQYLSYKMPLFGITHYQNLKNLVADYSSIAASLR